MKLTVLVAEPGRLTLDIEHRGAAGVLVVDVYEEDEVMCFGITQLVAKIDAPPRQWLALVRTAINELSAWAKGAGCMEIRVAGRDWSRILTDFEPFDGPRNGLRKVL